MRWIQKAADSHARRMKLYFDPLACSLGSRIAAYEADVALDLRRGRRHDQARLRRPRLPHRQSARPRARAGARRRQRADRERRGPPVHRAVRQATSLLHQWLCFIGTELHKGFVPVIDKTAPPDVPRLRARAGCARSSRTRPRTSRTATCAARRLLGRRRATCSRCSTGRRSRRSGSPSVRSSPRFTRACSSGRPSRRAFDEERALYLAER